MLAKLVEEVEGDKVDEGFGEVDEEELLEFEELVVIVDDFDD